MIIFSIALLAFGILNGFFILFRVTKIKQEIKKALRNTIDVSIQKIKGDPVHSSLRNEI